MKKQNHGGKNHQLKLNPKTIKRFFFGRGEGFNLLYFYAELRLKGKLKEKNQISKNPKMERRDSKRLKKETKEAF